MFPQYRQGVDITPIFEFMLIPLVCFNVGTSSICLLSRDTTTHTLLFYYKNVVYKNVQLETVGLRSNIFSVSKLNYSSEYQISPKQKCLQLFRITCLKHSQCSQKYERPKIRETKDLRRDPFFRRINDLLGTHYTE